MDKPSDQFSKIAYQLAGKRFGIDPINLSEAEHQFDARNIHPKISEISKSLFDSGHYKQATFEAYILIENIVKTESSCNNIGFSLMMNVFNENNPLLCLNDLANDSDKDEQQGFKHIFAGVVAGIRNPRGHQVDIAETMTECLDHLSLASLLIRKIDGAS